MNITLQCFNLVCNLIGNDPFGRKRVLRDIILSRLVVLLLAEQLWIEPRTVRPPENAQQMEQMKQDRCYQELIFFSVRDAHCQISRAPSITNKEEILAKTAAT